MNTQIFEFTSLEADMIKHAIQDRKRIVQEYHSELKDKPYKLLIDSDKMDKAEQELWILNNLLGKLQT